MIILKVPYAEKDEAKALGARWNNARKVWYVPDGQAAAPFERWIAPNQSAHASAPSGKPASAPSGRIDSAGGKPVIGKHFLQLPHTCNPFVECAECRPALDTSGWRAAYDELSKVLQTLGGK